MSNLKVVVRVRPISKRELEIKSVPSVTVDNNVVAITNIKVPEHHAGDSRERIRKFAFDYCYNENSTQHEIFSMVEKEVSTALMQRYHACVLAYGQSSTGKTYTMMGLQDEPGLTPKLCENIFKYFQSSVMEEEIKELRTSVSYLEIYNERVQDLLSSYSNVKSLKVREHPKKGPYVQGLSEHVVENSQQLLNWLSTGNGNRRVAATLNNRRSSRSHSVFTISCSFGAGSCCRLHLVDLAGSERAHPNQISAAPRLKEGANINRSLVALGNVICALADQSGKLYRNSRKRFVPYRDSVLTWLLKETLGGNAKTIMIATISPSSACYSETLNTLRFGQRAKQIVNRPVVNEDAKEKIIRELRAEIVRLKELISLQQQVDLCPIMTEYPKPIQEVNGTDEESNLSQTETEELESSDTLIEPITEAEQKEDKTEENFTKTDKLIPVIDITSSVKPKPVQLNRTLSVDFPKSVIGKLKKEFGSHEILPRRSSIKPQEKSKENSSRSGSISESSGKSTPKKSLTRRVYRRSEVVAAVTQRLYSQQIKKKEVNKSKMEEKVEPRQNICSNARIRLQELTQRALKASKRKIHSETQTEENSTVRMKEKSTDVNDINLALLKVKDANVAAITPTQNVGVSCLVENYNKTIKLTKSCSSQTEDSNKNQTVSFTKYLQNPMGFHSYSQPIYTSSVNINVSPKFNPSKDESFDDSLEDFANQNVYYSTPDLISNHNSLEANLVQKSMKSTSTEEKFVKDHPKTEFTSCEFFATSIETCKAKIVEIPPLKEKVTEVKLPIVFLPEIKKLDDFKDVCFEFEIKRPKVVKPIVKETSRSVKTKMKPRIVYSSDSEESDTSLRRKDMEDVLQTFMDEATFLLTKLKSVKKFIEYSDELRQKKKHVSSKECYVQTYFSYHDASSQTSFSVFDPDQENKWEETLKSSCDKLEQCVKLAEFKSREQERKKHFDLFDNLHKFPQPFSCDSDWKSQNEYSSLDTSHSASDYGSLPRKDTLFRRTPYKTFSPKAYMKHLVELRREIVNCSRNSLLQDFVG